MNKEWNLKISATPDSQIINRAIQEFKMSNIFTNTSVPLTIKYFRTTLTKGLVPNDYQELLNTSEFTNLVSQMAFASGVYEYMSKNTIIEIDKLLEDIESEIKK